MCSSSEKLESRSSEEVILLVGAGGHAISCIDVIERTGRFRIAGLVGGPSEIGTSVSGYEVLGSDEDLATALDFAQNAMVVVGQIKTSTVRERLYEQLVLVGFNLPVVISPSATVSDRASLGAGTIVMHGAIVNSGAKIAENCIVNSRALVEHGVRVGAHCHVATGAILNGDVVVGSGTFVGSGVVVQQGVHLGSNCIIGMGSIITRHVPDGAVVRRDNCV